MVQNDIPGEQKPPAPGPDKEILLLITFIAIAVIVCAAVAVIIASGLLQSDTASPAFQDSPTPLSPTGSQNPQSAAIPPSGQVTPRPTPEPIKKPVDFILEPADLVNCGLTCRQLTARITNIGDTKAHNVCISLRMLNSRQDVIGLNGGETLSQCIGDLDSHQTKSEPVIINADCGALAYKCLKETLTLETEVTSNEATIRFPDKLITV